MNFFRSALCPAWRRVALNCLRHESIPSTKPPSVFANVQKPLAHNVLVFEYKDRVLPVLGVIGLIQFLALDLVAYWSFYLFGTVTAKPENLTSNSSLLERAATIVPTRRFRYMTNFLIVLLS